MEEGADARAGGKDAAHETTTHARPAAAAPVPPEVSVAAILEAVRVRGERAVAEEPRAAPEGGQAGVEQEDAGGGLADGETADAGAGRTGTGGRSSPGPPVTFPRARIFFGFFGGPGRFSTLSSGPVCTSALHRAGFRSQK